MKATVIAIQETSSNTHLEVDYNLYDNAGAILTHFGNVSVATNFPTTDPDLDVAIRAAIVADAATHSHTITAADVINPFAGFSMRTFVSGVMKDKAFPYVSSAAVAGGAGVVRFYLTDDGTSGGNAVYSEIFADSIQPVVLNSANLYIPSAVSIDAAKKYVDVTMQQQTFATGLVALLNVVTGASFTPAPNGTTVKVTVLGK